ncbi:heavy metal efflux pump, CzcA family [Fibrella aestuarina BUZ 2]|uniref:Heavy metal efflux pump, CzcA family n=1 Tax=Fibrella aestuarina BUZ 2 TaxID=1166018 RepID=I0K290_9BACT|nr:CusA/CzcA family heavy metal efflux RND transporter [Fibrella aestuarina]CCG98243.1 heavy metal efflux pump, CzcA family [Fibrella aestuarina BUZ 2]
MNKFIRSIITFSLTNRFAVFFGILLLIVGGVVSFLNTPVETFPDVTNTNTIVITQWPGRSAEEVERYVTIPLETELNSVPRKTTLRSVSLFGLSVVTMIFDDGVDNFTAQTNVANRIANVDLPEGVQAEIQPPYGPTGEIYRFTLESKTKDITELKSIQDWVIERQIKSVPGIADVVSFGGKVKTIEVSLDPTLLANYGFTTLDVDDAIHQSNINVGGDVIKQGNQSLVVRGIGLLTKPEDVAGIIIDNVNGVPVRVRDVGTVRESFQPRLGIVGRNKQDDVVECIVVMRKGENPNEVIPALKEKIDELNNSILPKDVKIKTFYDRTTLNNYTMHTVGENVFLGIFLVTVILLLFLADWRTTLTVAIVIPLALLFAFVCLKARGMTANLLSIGALDFGIIIDGAVVMVEGVFVMLAHRAETMGMMQFNKRAKLSWIAGTATEVGKSIFIAKIIIITALLPIFAFQKVEGKLFSPLAWTIGFALLGALIVSLTLIPLLCSLFLKKNVRERHNPLVEGLTKGYTPALDWAIRKPKTIIGIAVGALLVSGFLFLTRVGSEFLPGLNEGSIYVRASLPYSVSLDESYAYTRKFRAVFSEFPEVRGVISQTGRPNDGTDPTGFFNNEFFVDLYPKEDWPERNNGKAVSKEELIEQMRQKLARFRGVTFGFSQPISDNVEEAVSGVKGSMAIKIIGQDLNVLDKEATQVYNVMRTINGVEDLGVFRNLGQPEFRITLDPQKLALYNVPTEMAQSVIETAIGGKTVTQYFEGERRYDVKVRYGEQFRYSPELIENLLVPTRSGAKVPLKEIATIGTQSGPAFVYRENSARFIAIKFSVRGRDLGSTIAEAQKTVAQKVKLPDGYRMRWAGEFENQTRAEKTLEMVVPISIVMIFLILLFTFGSALDATLVILNVPFALIGGFLSLWLTGINFSISAGVGFICLFGVSVLNGVILLGRFKENQHNKMNINDAVREGAISLVRPIVMTALMASLGLLPAALSTGIGSETQKPLATVMIGGLITSTILSLLILPVMYDLIYTRQHRKKQAKREEALTA